MPELFPFGDCCICGAPAISRSVCVRHLYCDLHWSAYTLQLDEAYAALGETNNNDSDSP